MKSRLYFVALAVCTLAMSSATTNAAPACWACVHGCTALTEALNCKAEAPASKKKRPNIKRSALSAYAQANAIQRAAVRNDVNKPAQAVSAPAGAMDVGGFKITDAILAKVMPDLRYAAALSKQNGNKVTQPCLAAVLKLVDSWQVEVKDDAGNVLALPEPHFITFLEKQSQLLRQLQADSDISIGCGAMAQALKKDILSLVGGLLSGGALGLFKLPLPFP